MPPTPSATFEEPKQKDHWNCQDWNCEDCKEKVPVASVGLVLSLDLLVLVLVVLPYRVRPYATDR